MVSNVTGATSLPRPRCRSGQGHGDTCAHETFRQGGGWAGKHREQAATLLTTNLLFRATFLYKTKPGEREKKIPPNVFLRERKKKNREPSPRLPQRFSFSSKFNSNLDSGCWHIPSLPACSLPVCACACGNVWVCGFCFAFCTGSADHLLLSPVAACTAQPSSIICQAGLLQLQLHAQPTLLLQELQETWLAGIPALWVQQSCSHCQSPREGLYVEGRVPRLQSVCPLGQGTGSTKQGTSAASHSRRAPLTTEGICLCMLCPTDALFCGSGKGDQCTSSLSRSW